jgi:hypothetical protein
MPLARIRCEVDASDLVPPDACIACAEGTPRHARRCQFTGSLLRALYETSSRRDAGISATMLTGCLRQAALEQLLPYTDRPSRRWSALRGTLFHALVEEAHAPHLIVEVRFRKAYAPGQYLTGKMDEVDPVRQVIVDYKTSTELPLESDVRLGGRKESWVWQTNIYRWLLDGGERMDTGETVHYPIQTLGIVVMTMREVGKYNVPLLDLEQVERYIRQRAEPLARALADGVAHYETLPPPGYDPFRHPLCLDWCPVRDACLRFLDQEVAAIAQDQEHEATGPLVQDQGNS